MSSKLARLQARIAELEAERDALAAEMDLLAEHADFFLNLDHGQGDTTVYAADGTALASDGFWIMVDPDAAGRLMARAERSATDPAGVSSGGHTDPENAE